MKTFALNAFAVVVIASLTSCGGGSVSTPATLHVAAPATYAAPADVAVPMEHLDATRLNNDRSRRPLQFDSRHAELASGAGRAPLSSLSGDEHGADGIGIFPGGSYRGLYAVHTAYGASDIQLGSTQAHTVFAPTSHMSDGSCLEVGNAYYNNAGSAVIAQFYVYDFCATPPAFAFLATIDDSFVADYVRVVNRDKATGGVERLPYYITEITASGNASLSAQTQWTALLYNHTKHAWERVYSNVGSTGASSLGWSIFEDYYPAGPCAALGPKFSVDSLKLYNGQTHRWESVTPQMAGKTTSVNPFSQSNCFYGDTSGPATYSFALETENGEWEVVTAQ
jgi:hypothetical protein